MTREQKAIAPEPTAVSVALWRALHPKSTPRLISSRTGLAPSWPQSTKSGGSVWTWILTGRSPFGPASWCERGLSTTWSSIEAGRGARQNVILGAGLDTFVWRKADAAPGLVVFEVDQPGPQDWKRQRLETIGLGVPDGLRFAPVDFEAGETWRAAIDSVGFDADQPAVVASMGVSMYLTRGARIFQVPSRRVTTARIRVSTWCRPAGCAAPAERRLQKCTTPRRRRSGRDRATRSRASSSDRSFRGGTMECDDLLDATHEVREPVRKGRVVMEERPKGRHIVAVPGGLKRPRRIFGSAHLGHRYPRFVGGALVSCVRKIDRLHARQKCSFCDSFDRRGRSCLMLFLWISCGSSLPWPRPAASGSPRLFRTQSAVSQAIANLEHQLRVKLFDRSGHRPVVTPEGEGLLGNAWDILLRVDAMRARARGLGDGFELELTLTSTPSSHFPL